MTITVTITHDTPTSTNDIVVRPCDVADGHTTYAGAAYDKLLKPGESAQFHVWPGRILSIDEQVNE